MRLGPFAKAAADLAPGDSRALEADWSDFSVDSIVAPGDPSFDRAYARLWREFGASGGMERREVIVDRLAWDPRTPVDGYAMRYEMVAVQRHGELVGVRDHTAIVHCDSPDEVVVHLSHVVVEPAMRGSGLASWLRAWPIQMARACAAAAFKPVTSAAAKPRTPRIVLAAEMEHPTVRTPAVATRLRSYARAGFLMIDPERAHYAQPDFRSADEIDGSEIRPLPLVLVIRRVGREGEETMMGAELRRLVTALYAMYGVHVRSDHMAPVLALRDRLPRAAERVALESPWPDSERPDAERK